MELFQNIAADLYGYADVPDDMPGLSENLLQVSIYFKTLNRKTTTEEPVYETVIYF